MVEKSSVTAACHREGVAASSVIRPAQDDLVNADGLTRSAGDELHYRGARAPQAMRILCRLGAEDQALLGHDRAGPGDCGVGGHLVHKVIVVTRIVMEDD